MRLIIINGYAGSGKSTLAFKYAKENDFALLIQDHFLFKMNPSSLITKFPTIFDHKIALKNMISCIENYMKTGKDIVLEGALVSLSENDPMELSHFSEIANKYSYKLIVITLIADDKIRIRRQKKRGCVLLPRIDKKLVNANIEQMLGINNIIIDTSKLTIKKSLAAIDQVVSK